MCCVRYHSSGSKGSGEECTPVVFLPPRHNVACGASLLKSSETKQVHLAWLRGFLCSGQRFAQLGFPLP